MDEQNQTPSPTAAADDAHAVPGTQQSGADDLVAQLTQQVADLEAKAKEHYDMFLRATADGENIRRRAQDDVAKAHKFAIENFADNLLPVMDSLAAALADLLGRPDRAALLATVLAAPERAAELWVTTAWG